MRKVILVTITLLLGSCLWVSAQTNPQTGGQKRRNLNVVATAHLDTQWRWTIQNTINWK